MGKRAVGAGVLRRDLRPYAALGGLLALLLVLLAVPQSRAWLAEEVWRSVEAQAHGRSSGGYSLASMLAWALSGAVLAWVAYDLVFLRLRYAPDALFFLALAPFLLIGPLVHALLLARALPVGSVLAYLATEPPVYLTVALLAMGALAAGRVTGRPVAVPLSIGIVVLAPLLVLAAGRLDGSMLVPLAVTLLLALAPAALAAVALRHRERPLTVAALVGAHALDGATTWMFLRDPFGLGFERFGEKNDVSRVLVETSNGWPFYAVKLALPLAVLFLVKPDETEARTRAFLLFAVFVLGYGPGMSNLLQVLLA